MGCFGHAALKVILLSCFVLLTSSTNCNQERELNAGKSLTLSKLLLRESQQDNRSRSSSSLVKQRDDQNSGQNMDEMLRAFKNENTPVDEANSKMSTERKKKTAPRCIVLGLIPNISNILKVIFGFLRPPIFPDKPCDGQSC